ncbi:MAG: HAD-IC family P-type ATPase, partial [Methanoregulaceae archaeon]|nr:HAD-IC family P-type ATPase [Methanoregulaceae archaeon]
MSEELPGLTSTEAKDRLEKFGPNEIYRRTPISFLGIARHEITEPMILLLLFIGVVYSIWGELFDAATIIVVIGALVLVEVANEYRAKSAISALERISEPKAKVIRDGRITVVDTADVVPGDLLVLTTGTKVPADATIRQSVALQTDESALTGESFPVEKLDGDQIFAGTVIVSGEGDAKVSVTGPGTRLGQLASSARVIRPPRTRLQLEMKALAGKLVYIAVIFSLLITVIGVLRGNDLRTMVLTGLSLSFATIPEELPIIITMVLGLGAYQLSKKNFLVKRLNAAETMGNTTVIVTDKTGTLTEGRMEIAGFFPANNKEQILECATRAIPLYSASPIDAAVRSEAGAQVSGRILRQADFRAGRKIRSLLREEEGGPVLYATGAPEEIFRISEPVPDEAGEELAKETAAGRRLIAVARRKIDPARADDPILSLERGLSLAGFISFEDPPRKGVKETVALAAKAGIRTIMVTGDHPATAAAIARTIGVLSPEGKVLSGGDLDPMSAEELRAAVKEVQVFARTTPDHKYRIVQALQQDGETVAVTGDGINDALALKGADVGIAMGIRGTDVAKDAAEVILADDNYITITNGIFEGRKFVDNLRKGIRYYLSIKVALIAIFLLPVLAGIRLPFAPIQIIVL